MWVLIWLPRPSLKLPRDNVCRSPAEYAKVSYYNSTIVPSGTGVTSTSVSGSGSAPSCSFASYPSL